MCSECDPAAAVSDATSSGRLPQKRGAKQEGAEAGAPACGGGERPPREGRVPDCPVWGTGVHIADETRLGAAQGDPVRSEFKLSNLALDPVLLLSLKHFGTLS